ncbi:hypothetical protein BKA64DRAFT_641262 [Cadophora sp. MPI-SDFR-AT-0126]|nr:hypothetical protein BKA64DRAFT_641262 [Leotiomycetes sp. MPI-SDFR-AT-0126]
MASSDNASAGEPEIFKARGLVVDTRLQVFGATFLVHSTILKLYSQYFATYMDSADKVKSTTAGDSGLSTAFQYEWVTKVLDGGTDWQLVSAGPKAGDPTVTPSHIDPEKETIAFRNLLNAMYNIPYTLLAEEIIALTKVAAFYMALPVVSRSLKRVFWDSREFIAEEIRNNPSEILALLRKQMTLGRKIKDSQGGKLLMPKLVRDLYREIKLGEELGTIKESVLDDLEDLTANGLHLGTNTDLQAGDEDGSCEDYFLIDYMWWDEYPWDFSQLDW